MNTENTVDAPPPESDVVISAAELAALRKQSQERAQYLELARRTQADFENYQKRNQRERDQERKYMLGSLVLELLPVFDNLDRAISSSQQTGEKGSLVDGVLLVQNQFLELLKRHGVTRIEALGKSFDPNLHQAVMQRTVEGAEPNSVLQVLEQGFMIHDRVLRPAKVIVAT
jgi:molecular chaperone GrpE